MRRQKKLIGAAILICFSTATFAQSQKFDLAALSAENKLTIVNRNLETLDASRSVRLDEQLGQGLVWIKDLTLSTGTIEIDLKGKDVLQRSFVGVAFHGRNDFTFEAIYFRPFNFHAKDSVRKIHAVQYISHPDFRWERLRKERNGEFEKGIDNAPDPNGWFHARIVITEKTVVVYVNQNKTPSLTVQRLSTENTGGIALWTGDGSGGEFANLSITTP
jgi:hypothetical protein